MTTTTTNGLANTMTSPASNDLLDIWNVAAGRLDKITRANLVGATITGGGTIALGGFTLTIPASGTIALLGGGNIFTATQTFGPSTISVIPAVINSPASASVVALDLQQATTRYAAFFPPALSENSLFIVSRDIGALRGPGIAIGRNSNGSTPAAGRLILTARDDTSYRVWADVSGNLRIWGAGDPTNANDASGTVVGAQTSMAAAKNISEELSPMADVLARVRQGADAVKRFTYRSGAFGGQEFEGVVIDDAPDYGMDRDKKHPAGKSLNEINIAGDLLRFAAWAMQRIEALEAKLS